VEVSGPHRSYELKLPTKTVAVRVALLGAQPAAAEMFVADIPRRCQGDLLDDLAAQLGASARFVPVRSADRVRLLGKHAISWVAVDRDDPGQPASPDVAPQRSLELSGELTTDPNEELTLYDRQHLVEVELIHAAKLVGTMLDSLPADRPRVIDYLNQAGRFLRLWTTTEHYLINASQVIAVTELGEAT